MHVSLIDVSSGSCFQCFDTVAWVPVTGRSLTCKYMLQRLLGAGGHIQSWNNFRKEDQLNKN